jgi:hypothetical protein
VATVVVVQDFLPGFEPPPDLTSDDKYTPDWLWPHIQKAIAGDQRIALDPCADPARSFPARHHITAAEDCLTTDWSLLLAENEAAAPRTAYMNPPYSDSEPFLRRWVEYVDGGIFYVA